MSPARAASKTDFRYGESPPGWRQNVARIIVRRRPGTQRTPQILDPACGTLLSHASDASQIEAIFGLRYENVPLRSPPTYAAKIGRSSDASHGLE